MQKRTPALLVVFSLFLFSGIAESVDSVPKPLRASELVALIAGNVLPANITHEVNTRGLNFRPDASYLDLLKKAGADPAIFSAVQKSKHDEVPAEQPELELCEHLSSARALMLKNQYSGAAQELNTAIEQSFAESESGFVMGELLREQENWENAAIVYTQVLREDPEFPEAHTKLSYILYKMEDLDGALNEAKSAIAQNPDDAEAHKNAGLALEGARKYDAAETEYREALRLKPDYAVVHYDLGILFYDQRIYSKAIAEYRKSIALDPDNFSAHYNLGLAYDDAGGIDGAIREYREATRIDPNQPESRQNLAVALMKRNPREAISVLHELESKFPDFQLCHDCLGSALHSTGDSAGARKEFEQAIQLDPSDALPHVGLGEIDVDANSFDAALEEFRTAESLDSNLSSAHEGVAEALTAKDNIPGAIAEMKQAELLAPIDWHVHEHYAHLLLAAGNTDLALSEYKEALTLNPKHYNTRVEIGTLLEKKGDWAEAMVQYRRASLDEATANADHPPGETFHSSTDAEKAYHAAQTRFEQHVLQLKADSKSAEASSLQSSVRSAIGAEGSEAKLESVLQDGSRAFSERRFDDAVISYKNAIEIAKSVPDNKQMAFALERLANTYGMKGDFKNASATFHQELELVEKAYGPQSPQVAQPLTALGRMAAYEKNYATAEDYLTRALTINQTSLGENSGVTVESLRSLAGLYMSQQLYAKAEPYLLRAVRGSEANTGADDSSVLVPLWGLCDLYDRWQKPAQAEPCYKRSVEILEKNYGNGSVNLVPALENEAKALTALGRNDEAGKLEQRSEAIKNLNAKKY